MALRVNSLNPLARLSRIRFVRGFGITLIVLAIALALAPTIIAKTGISSWLIARATQGLPISVTVGSLSLGWFSPIVAEDVVVRDAEGITLAQIPRVQTERNLMNLAYSRADLGKIRIERTTVDLVFSNNSSNLESLLSKWPKSEAKPPAGLPRRGPAGPSFSVEFVEGTVKIVDADKGKNWQLAKVEIRLTHDGVSAPPLRGSATAAVTGEGDPGAIDIGMSGEMSAVLRGQLTAKLQSIPVALAEVMVRRSLPDLICGGRLNGEAGARWLVAQDGTPVFQLKANLNGKNLEAQGGPLGRDHLVVREVVMPLDVEYNGAHLSVKTAQLKCDYGTASASGKFVVNRPFYDSLSEPDIALQFDLDLAGLAVQLPQTVKLHRDVTLTSGRIAFDAKSGALNNGAKWVGKLTTTDFRATRAGVPISWVEPISLSFIVRQMPQSLPDIADLKCTARFMAMEGLGTPKSMRLHGSADLGQLATQLGQFIDIGAWGLAGRAEATLVMERPDLNSLEIKANGKLDQFQWGPWREERLSLDAQWKMHTENERKTIDKSSHVRITSGADLLEVTLREPVVVAKSGQSGSVYVKLDGDLARWQQRLKPLAGVLGDVNLQGQAKAEAWILLSPKKIDVQSVLLTAQDLTVKLGGLNIHDPNLKIQASMTYSPEQNLIEMKASQLTGEAILLHTGKLSIDLNRQTMAGTVVYRGDLGRVHRWFAAPVLGGDVWAGSFNGEAKLLSTAEAFDIELTGNIRNAAFGPPKAPRFTEKNVQLSAKGNYFGKQGALSFEKIQLISQLGTIDAKARLGKLDSTMDLDITGSLIYDLATAEPLLKSYLGAGARIKGKDRRDFRLAGSLRPKGATPGAVVEIAALQGNAGLNWQQIVAYGAEVGPADLKANLHAGWLRVDPFTASLNQGKLSLSPSIRLDSTPQELVMPAGPVIENAKITKEMCASALGYTLPLIANVATAEGELSMTLGGARVPFGDAAKAEMHGVIVLHHAKVGPSPLIVQITGLLKTVAPFSVIRENQVKFKLEKGRVHHENLELNLPDNLTVRTSGSVGLDGSLSMIAEMPIPAKLLGFKIPPALARVPLRLPIAGTVDHPQIDSRALQDLVKQAAREAGSNLLEDQFKKLFGPKK